MSEPTSPAESRPEGALPWRDRAFSGWTVLYVLSLSVPTCGLLVGLKVDKLARTGHLDGLLLADLCTPELVFLGAWSLFWLALIAATNGWRRWLAAAVLHLATLAMLAGGITEHSFFVATGSTLDWEMVVYAWKYFSMIGKVLASEVRPVAVVGLLGTLAAVLLPLLLLRRVPGDRGLAPTGRWRQSAPAVLGLGCLLLVSAPLYIPNARVPTRLYAARTLVPGSLARDAVLNLLGLGESDDPVQASKPVRPLVVTPGPNTKPYNVVLFMLESMRWSATTPYDSKLQTMPFLARLAKEGVVVEQAYTTIPHTTKSITPIQCGLFAKVTPYFEEANPGALPSDCLARVLRRFGYATGHFIPSETVYERNRELLTEYGYQTIVGIEDYDPTGFEETSYFGYEDKSILKPVLSWVDKQKEPFLLSYMSLISHHYYGLPSTWKKRAFAPPGDYNKYLNTILYTDEFIAELYKGFEERGLLDNTVFVFIGDHGEGFGEHGLYQHDAVIYEEGLRVPFILHGAGVAKGRRVEGLRQNVDVMPTILDVLGLEIVAGDMAGKSVLSSPGHERLFYSCWHNKHCMAMREGSIKTIWNYDRSPAEVYDLDADPGEKKNLAGTDAAPTKVIEERIEAMKRWKKQVNATYTDQESRRKRPFVSRSRPEVTRPVDIDFGGYVKMIGWDVDRTEVPAGEAAWLTYVFEVKQKPPEGWKLFVHVQGPHETLLIYDHVPVNNSYPVKDWQAGEFVIDRNWVRLDPGDRPGTYEVFMGFYDKDNDDERATVSGSGLPYAPSNKVLISELKVSSDKRDFEPEPVGREALPEMLRKHVRDQAVVGLPSAGTVDYNVRFGDCIELYRVEFPQQPVIAGKTTTARYHFKVLGKVPRWSGLFVHLNGPDKKYHNATHTPVAGTYAPDRWQPGDFIEDIHEITVPADYPAGPYQVSMGFWNSAGRLPIDGGGKRVDKEMRLKIGTLQVVAPIKTAEP